MRTLLIICSTNSCRSQMAEGLVNHLLPDKWRAFSAGVKATEVNPRAVEAMKEIKIDISRQRSKSIAEINDLSTFNLIITVCDEAADTCPALAPEIPQVHLGFDDPAAYSDDTDENALPQFRAVRDDIRERLIGFLAGR